MLNTRRHQVCLDMVGREKSKLDDDEGKVPPWVYALGAVGAIGAACWMVSKDVEELEQEAQLNNRYRLSDKGQHARPAMGTTNLRVMPSSMPSRVPTSRQSAVDAVNALFGVQLDDASMAKVVKDEALALVGDAYLNYKAKLLRGGHMGAQGLITNEQLAVITRQLGITTHFLAPHCNGSQVPSVHSQGTAVEALLGWVLRHCNTEQADEVIHIMSEFLS